MNVSACGYVCVCVTLVTPSTCYVGPPKHLIWWHGCFQLHGKQKDFGFNGHLRRIFDCFCDMLASMSVVGFVLPHAYMSIHVALFGCTKYRTSHLTTSLNCMHQTFTMN